MKINKVNVGGEMKEMTGREELSLIASNMDSTRCSAIDDYTTEQLLKIYRAQLASGWDFLPDQWTSRQHREALKGIVPQWDENEMPIYAPKKKPRKKALDIPFP